ncbi:MAG: outer membrane protein assembly factor BamB family protein, partial [Planctomycetota bacterium]
HGLDADPKNVAAAREHVKSLGVYGRVSVDRLLGRRLPYMDNLINLVVSEYPSDISVGEVMRVLRPGGVAYLSDGGTWKKTVKPRPTQIDEWTHFLHGPDNNAVAHDSVVDVPRRLQWLGRPKFARAHEQAASLSACVTTAGRLFYVIDETPRADIRFPSRWFLVARDAFNGVVLWKRPIPTWVDQLRRFRAGPAGTAFRLAAKDDRVYVTLGIDAPVSILDAETGRTLAICRRTENARQILRLDEKLLVLVDTAPQTSEAEDSRIRRGLKPAPGTRAIVAADAASGRTLWRKQVEPFVHPTLAAQGDRLFYQTNEHLFCVDVSAAEQLWRAPMKLELAGHEQGWESPTLVVHGAAVYCADLKKTMAYSVRDGTPLWRAASKAGYNSPPDVFVVDGLVWMKGKGMVGLDPATGEVKRELPTVPGYMHHRCYRNKATDRFFVRGDQGVQFVDLKSGDVSLHHWIRGTCQYGIMPANGLLYVTPDSCACNMKAKLAGFWALAPAEKAEGGRRRAEGGRRKAEGGREFTGARLERGPAYGVTKSPPSALHLPPSEDWPVYRHDAARSGTTRAEIPVTLQPAWRAEIGGRLSGVTAAGGRVFVASVDTHTVCALDQRSGETLWTFTAGGRVDSPPTIYKGTALFGSADGWVYALRAADGKLAWRFRAAPEDRRTFVNGQLESVWPVHGSVLVHQGKVVVAAGRSSYLDGGIRLYRLDFQTGRMLSETVMYSPDPETGKQPTGGDRKDVRGVLSDVLLADAADVYMRHVKLDFETGSQSGTGVHLFSPIGLLDDTWWHRGYWVMHDRFISHWSGWWRVGNYVPSGRILSYDGTSVFGYGRDKYPGGNTGQWRGGEKYRLFACDRPSPGLTTRKPEARPPKSGSAK